MVTMHVTKQGSTYLFFWRLHWHKSRFRWKRLQDFKSIPCRLLCNRVSWSCTWGILRESGKASVVGCVKVRGFAADRYRVSTYVMFFPAPCARCLLPSISCGTCLWPGGGPEGKGGGKGLAHAVYQRQLRHWLNHIESRLDALVGSVVATAWRWWRIIMLGF